MFQTYLPHKQLFWQFSPLRYLRLRKAEGFYHHRVFFISFKNLGSANYLLIFQLLIPTFPLNFDYLVKRNFNFEYFRNIFVKIMINFASITIIVTIIITIIVMTVIINF